MGSPSSDMDVNVCYVCIHSFILGFRAYSFNSKVILTCYSGHSILLAVLVIF